jgi:hypothetical protein
MLSGGMKMPVNEKIIKDAIEFVNSLPEEIRKEVILQAKQTKGITVLNTTNAHMVQNPFANAAAGCGTSLQSVVISFPSIPDEAEP